MEIYGQHYGGLASGIWCERCRQAGHEAKMCVAREPRRFNGLCDTCCELGHLSCDCLLQRDRIYSDVPTLFSLPQSNRSGPGYDIPCYDLPISPPSYSGRSGGPGYDILVLRHSTVVVIAIVRNRLCDATTAATVQRRCNISTAVATTATVTTGVRSSSTATAPMVARGTVRHFRNSSQAPAPSLALSGTRGTTAATVQRRHSSHAPAPSLTLAGSRGTLAAMDRR